MTTREAIYGELAKRAYPQTAAMLRDVVGKSTVQLLCRCMALEGAIVERKFSGGYWYGVRPLQFERPYRLEERMRAGRGGQWVTREFFNAAQGGRQSGAYWARHHHNPFRLMHHDQVIYEWNTEEKRQWQDGKRTLVQLKKILRDPSHSRTVAFTPAPTSHR